MRTEDDLRTALTSLEQHAPAAARVLPGTSRRSRRGPRSPLALRWVAGIAATAAVAGAVTAVTLTGGTSSTMKNEGGSSPPPATHTAIQAKLLAALSSTAGDIVYTHETDVETSSSGHTSVIESSKLWAYPVQPSVGQQVRNRSVVLNGAGHPTFDTETSYKQPDLDAKPGASVTGKEVSVYYVGKTWSEYSGGNCVECAGTPNGRWVTQVATAIKQQNDKKIGSGTVDGHRAVEFRWPGTVLNGSMDLWVDASTYLPVRLTMVSAAPGGVSDTSTVDFQFLSASPANLAKLITHVPAGFRQVPLADLSNPAYAKR